MQFVGEVCGYVFVILSFFCKGSFDSKYTFISFSFKINTCDQIVAEDKRVNVVTVLTFWLRHIDFDAIEEVKNTFDSISVPHEWIERG